MAPNASVPSMEFLEATGLAGAEPCHLRRSNHYGRSSISPSLMQSRLSPPPSFNRNSSVKFEKLPWYSCRPSTRNFNQFRYQNSHAVSTKVPLYFSGNQFRKFTPKRRTQSESVSTEPIQPMRKELQVEAIRVTPKSSSNNNVSALSDSKSAPSKLPFAAVTCAELEAAVSQTRPKLLTCAELEALQAQVKNDVLQAMEVGERKTGSPVAMLAEKKKLESTSPIEEKKSESSVFTLTENSKPKSIVVPNITLPFKKALEAETEKSTPDMSVLALNLSQKGASRCPSISSDISTLEELVSRSSTPVNSCSSPVSSASSGYESCSESNDSSPKISGGIDDLMGDKLLDESDTVFNERKTVKKSLLADFIASETVDFGLQSNSASMGLACAGETESAEQSYLCPSLVADFQTLFATDAKQTNLDSGKKNSTKVSKKKSHLGQAFQGDLEISKMHFHRKNVSASGSSTKKNRKIVNAALPPSPSTVMPLSTSPPGALQLPSPPRAWRSDATASGDRRGSVQCVDITQEIQQMVGVAPKSSSGFAASGSPIIVY